MNCPLHPDKKLKMIQEEEKRIFQDILFKCPEGHNWRARVGWRDLLTEGRKFPNEEQENKKIEEAKIHIKEEIC